MDMLIEDESKSTEVKSLKMTILLLKKQLDDALKLVKELQDDEDVSSSYCSSPKETFLECHGESCHRAIELGLNDIMITPCCSEFIHIKCFEYDKTKCPQLNCPRGWVCVPCGECLCNETPFCPNCGYV